MPTVSKAIADKLVEGNGVYPGDEDQAPVVLIVEYDNQWGGLGYGLVYEGQPNTYNPSPYVRNPRTYWERQS